MTTPVYNDDRLNIVQATDAIYQAHLAKDILNNMVENNLSGIPEEQINSMVLDGNYVHTDNNFTDEYKNLVNDMSQREHTLDNLEDVVITTPSDGQILNYSSDLGKWINVDVPTSSSGGAMELIQTIEVTSAVSSIDITNLPDGIYEIRAVGLTSSVDSYLYLRAFNGVGNVLTGTEYSYSGINSNNSLNVNAYNNIDHIKAALGVVSAGTKANVNIKFSVSSVNKYLIAETLLFNYLYYPAYCVLGADVTTDKVTGIRIFESAGSIVAGTVYVYKLKV